MAATNVTTASFVASMMIAGLLAGCATGQQTAVSPPAATSASHLGQQPTAPYQRLTPKAGAFHVSPTAPAGTVSATWSMRSTALEASSRRIYLFVDVPVCSGGQMTFTVATTAKAIAIGYWIRPTPQGAICTAMKVYTDGYIQLPMPIGGRAIVHVPSGEHAAG